MNWLQDNHGWWQAVSADGTEYEVEPCPGFWWRAYVKGEPFRDDKGIRRVFNSEQAAKAWCERHAMREAGS